MPRAGHQIHGKEPNRQLRAGLVKDGLGTRVDVMAAMLARIGAPLGYPMKFRIRAAPGARELGTAVLDLHDPVEACAVVGVLTLEFLEGVLGHGQPLVY